MRLPRLVRRREIPVPTAFGALASAAIAAAIAFAALHALHPFLAPTEPVGGGVLVVEGWAGDPGFDEAARRFATGAYERVVATGGPIEHDTPIAALRTWAHFGAEHLAARGISPDALAAVPTPASAQDRTFLSAVTVRDWLTAHAIDATRIDVVTLGAHGRRSRLLHRAAFGDAVAVGVISAQPKHYDSEHWWRSSEGAKSVVTEAIGWAWTACCFTPPARGSHEEQWGPRE
jgi:hypothetical protein